MKKNPFITTAILLTFMASCDSYSDNIEPKQEETSPFVFELFKKAVIEDSQNNKDNTLISPLSVNLALNMVINGAEGETREEIMKTLGSQNLSVQQINEQSKELSSFLTLVDPGTSLSIANSIWYDHTFSIKDAFIQTNKDYYEAEVNAIDFSSGDAIRIINEWCSDKTQNRIPKVLDESPDLDNTIAMIINALHFKSDWSEGYAFDEQEARKEPFYASDGSNEEVYMMHRSGNYLYKSNTYASYLTIPFGNNAYNMVFILPNEDRTMQEVVNNIDYEHTWTTSDDMTEELVYLSLPKFKMDFSYDMRDFILPEMGMRNSFDPYLADFSGISDTPIFISKVIHKTTIEVNEGGAEAAAVTVVGFDVILGDSYEEPKTIDFKVNRPFIFSICEKNTGTVLFIGKIDKILQ